MGTFTEPQSPPPLVALAGDWHGNVTWAARTLHACARIGVRRLYHLGDFGVWPGGSGILYLDALEEVCAEHDIEIWVTPGNHEDYDQIAAIPPGRDGLQWIRPHVGLIPRGHRWSEGGRSFVSLGGAPSIDYESRDEGSSWWPAEMITEEAPAALAYIALSTPIGPAPVTRTTSPPVTPARSTP